MSRVYVGLSGGVDSAVAAAHLCEAGHDVTGVFIKIWQPEFVECTWRADRLDAMRVAAVLGIAFREIDLSAEYKRAVIDSMIHQYRNGVTPNPDVLCNREIKFGPFLSWALSEGAEYIATGHYTRRHEADGEFGLLRATDVSKDQTYFLHMLDQEMLAHTLFPLGELTKQEVRSRAAELRLPVAQKPDSQGLCFVGDIEIGEFLGRFIALEPGAVLDMSGRTIGEHRGAALYTTGQRHGFHVGVSAPHYIVHIDTQSNTITVTTDIADIKRGSVKLYEVHSISKRPLPLRLSAQPRYHAQLIDARLDTGSETRVHFDEPQLVSPGQSVVLYDGDLCLGGGEVSREAHLSSHA